jgi:hypothetical protein
MRRTALFFLLPVLGALPAVSQSVPGYVIANAKHYRESGVGNATGRTGSAHMSARALLGEDGNATIEVTTGALDSNATPPGSFGKVQFKPLDPNGNVILSQNFTPLSTATGYYSFSWPSLYRHQQAQIQANITGIDNRTDVVTLVDTVKLRPDLAVQKLFLPTSPVVSTPVTITANIAELNGDSPATTTCQLSVDGAVVDQASNVYVDAAGAVSCAFTYTFTSTGNHAIQVTAGNVIPADWDTGNNSASGTINVVNLITNIAEHGNATFSDQKGGFPLSHTSTYQAWFGGSSVYNYSDTTGTTGEEQDSRATFYSGGCAGTTNALPYQFPVDVAYTETMDGTSVYSVKATGIAGQSRSFSVNLGLCGSTAVTYIQQVGSGSADDHTFRVISNTYYDSASIPVYTFQQVDSTRSAGDVTYLSSGYECAWFATCNSPTDYYMWNTPSETVLGALVTLGNTWVPSMSVMDAGGNGFGGSLAVSLISTQYTTGQPNTCKNTGPDIYGYIYQTCTSTVTNYTETQGNALY